MASKLPETALLLKSTTTGHIARSIYSAHISRSAREFTFLHASQTRTFSLFSRTTEPLKNFILQHHLASTSRRQFLFNTRNFASSSHLSFAKESTKAAKMVKEDEYILTLSCPDRPGIVHAVTGFLTKHNLNIVDSQQFGDPTSLRFFMRVHFAPSVSPSSETEIKKLNVEELKGAFETIAQDMSMDFQLDSLAKKPRVLIMVSKIGHCLNDLLFRQSISQLGIEVPLIVSNHPDFEPLANTYKIPFHHLPVTAATKAEQESKILELVKENNIDLIVLARYMQVLSPTLCTAMSGKIINIHHSFLPSFKGAKPYHQAYDRGVKIVGATAHFVTSDLDEGPIIEQNVVRVGHGLSPKELTAEGSNVESNVLATAVKWVTERRVLLNGHKTVVFN
ncbi:d609279a-1b23-4286-828a-2fb68686da39 [Sclerotinia trifoliorum]|uniref:D609279a-1b23-4286-828a-2fb68686da39 n=1 Tax=Sclerotinia trifoliorum TaxID=28548 RepID=A0A8H2VPK6_9HELO|nr:d609279a-1b23-4286-828a-2fb68686da39 [Sclerotinia trifoliorum]